jgi:hypothetical protein
MLRAVEEVEERAGNHHDGGGWVQHGQRAHELSELNHPVLFGVKQLEHLQQCPP